MRSRTLLLASLLVAGWIPMAAAQPAPSTPHAAPPAATAPTAAPPIPSAAAGMPEPAAPPGGWAVVQTRAAPLVGPVRPLGAAAAEPDPFWWESYELRTRVSAKTPLLISGGVATGLGALALLASGVTWLTAWSRSLDLDRDCPGGYCVEGTRGADTYQAVRDLSDASGVLVAVALPTLASGVSLLVLGAGARASEDRPKVGATLKATGQGGSLEVTF